jgi:TRAP-type C4-dicarboxylate transport system permease large subunit
MVMSGTFNSQLRRGLDAANLPPAVVDAVIARRAQLAAIEPPADAGVNVKLAARRSIDEAFLAGFRRVMWIAAALALLSAVTGWAVIGVGAKPAPRSPASSS